MKAWVARGGNLQFEDVPDPIPASDELLVRVEATSLNRGEVRMVARAADGTIPGWDVAGVVVAPAANGEGPAAGTRVAALLNRGGWAELASVPLSRAAVVPDDVELTVAATLPIAGLTIVRALDVAGSLVGKRALITGGSGGVGQLAIQLAAIAGAEVTAVSRSAAAQSPPSDPERQLRWRTPREQHDALRELGARDVVANITDARGTFELVLESVGGASLAAAIDRVARGGVVVTIGNSSEEETTFNARALYAKGGASIYGLLIFEEMESRRITARDLERLLSLVANGRVHVPVLVKHPWNELPRVLGDLERRAYSGKAVLTMR